MVDKAESDLSVSEGEIEFSSWWHMCYNILLKNLNE